MQESCRKCGAPMGGPRYDRAADKLVYTCRCGHAVHRLPQASHPASSVQEAFARLMLTMNQKVP